MEAKRAPAGMHPEDLHWAFGASNQIPPYYGAPRSPGELERRYADGQTWTDAGYTYQVLHTPGHSPGSVSFFFQEQGVLASGDVLFLGAIGRTDLPGGDPRVLQDSLARLLKLPDETLVLTGHGPTTTIGQERQENTFLRDLA
jgi:glyoxylase-like metal-dependent hydrolase (beta-lactamase superfamily II)